MSETEEWRPVVGYEGLYEVSSIGRVKSLPRTRWTGTGWRTTRERILTPKNDTYPSVSLSRLGDPRTIRIHVLLLEAFVGPRPVGAQACHGDGDKWNCRLDNLRWDSTSANHQDRVLHGASNRGERSGTARLTRQRVAEIRARHSAGEPQRSLASAFGVHPSTISHLVHGKSWAA